MIRSMTAFARREDQGEWGSLTWELRSVNHRFLDVSMRLPDDFRAQENALRETISHALARGKVDCSLYWRSAEATEKELVVNETLARSVISSCETIEHWMNNPSRLSAMDVLRWPGVSQVAEQDREPVIQAAAALLKGALAELIETREREGARLKTLIEQRCEAIVQIVADVRVRRVQVMGALREKLLARIAEVQANPDNDRLEQELAFIAQRLDVDEELDRLDAHLKEITAVLARKEPVGRRLDFLMQELNREANTLGSKANDAQTTKASVDLKVLIEQMREQVQNVE